MLGTRLLLPCCTSKGRCRRIERVADRLFEGEEAVLHVRGVQIASEKRLNPWTTSRSAFPVSLLPRDSP